MATQLQCCGLMLALCTTLVVAFSAAEPAPEPELPRAAPGIESPPSATSHAAPVNVFPRVVQGGGALLFGVGWLPAAFGAALIFELGGHAVQRDLLVAVPVVGPSLFFSNRDHELQRMAVASFVLQATGAVMLLGSTAYLATQEKAPRKHSQEPKDPVAWSLAPLTLSHGGGLQVGAAF